MPSVPRLLLILAALLTGLMGATRPAVAQWPVGGVAIAPSPSTQSAPLAISDGRAPAAGGSGAIVVWGESRGTSGIDLYAQRILGNGQVAPGWPAAGVALCAANGTQSTPAMVSDGAGGAIVAWRDFRSGGPTATDVYAQHVTAAGAIASGWPANGLAVCTAGGAQRAPGLAPDGAGGAIAAWMDSRGGTAFADVYAQRFTGAGAIASGWSPDGNLVYAGNNEPAYPVALVSDGAGGAIGAWTYFGIGYYDVRAQRVDGAGNRRWGDLGVDIAAGYAFQYLPLAVSDGGAPTEGGSGALFVYQDNGASYPDDDICAQRLDSLGNPVPGWPSTSYGLPVCTAAGEQVSPVIIGDGAGGGFVSWKDSRAGAGSEDLYVQHLLGTGTHAAGWPGNGLAVCTAAGAQLSPALVRDAWDGAIVAWQDGRGGGYDIYAVRIAGDGTVVPGWTAGGTAVCTADGDQTLPVAVTDGAGGAIVIWQDARNGGLNLYAQRVSAGGLVAPVADVPSGPASPRLMLAARPNPAGRDLGAAFSLPDDSPATLELLDVSGRRLLVRDVGTLGAGSHVLSLAEAGALPAGIYLLRLTRGPASVTARAAIVR